GGSSSQGEVFKKSEDLIAESIKTHFSKSFAHSEIIRLNTTSLLTSDSLFAKIEYIKKVSRPEDIFLFYYTGETDDVSGSHLSFKIFPGNKAGNNLVSASQLFIQLEKIPASRKMYLIDAPAATLVSQMISDYA